MLTSKKLHLVSFVILCLFALIAFGSWGLEYDFKKPILYVEELKDGKVRITNLGLEERDGSERLFNYPKISEVRLDSKGKKHGPILNYRSGQSGYVEGNYKNGHRHGEFRHYVGGNPPDQLNGRLAVIEHYHEGHYIGQEKINKKLINNESLLISNKNLQPSKTASSTNIEEQIRNNWPWFIYDMVQGGIGELHLAAFTEELDAAIAAKNPSNIDEFIGEYYDAVKQIGRKPQYNALHDQYLYLGSIYRTDELRHFELRLAVFDLYLGRGNNLFKIVESDYPSFLKELRNKNLTTATIRGFLDRLEDNLRKMGHVNLEDTLYPFTIEERIEKAAEQVDGYESVKRALRDLAYEKQRKNDPLLQGAMASYQAKISDKVTGVTLMANPSGSSSPGQRVTFTAQATGGVSPHYEFYYRQIPGGKWMRAQSYSAKNTLEAVPNIKGEYEIGVLARSAASKAAYEAQAKIIHLFTASPAVQSVILSASPPSPTAPGQQITFTAQATGGVNPEFRFFYRSYPGGSWIPAGSYSTSNTFVGTSSRAGSYEIGVLARSAGSHSFWEAQNSIRHTIALDSKGPAFFEATTIVTSPQPDGFISITPYGFFDYINPGPFIVNYSITNTGEQAATKSVTLNAFVSFDFGETGHLVGGHVVENITLQPGQSTTRSRNFNGHAGGLWTFTLDTDDDVKEYKLLIMEEDNQQSDYFIFDNWNIHTVYNNPTNPTVFSISSPHIITYIDTYHWNGGQGKTPGTIALRHSDGTLYGPWPAKGVVSSGAPNGEWHVEPNVYIKAGTYAVIDSDPATWSHNSTSNNRGFSRVKGYEAY